MDNHSYQIEALQAHSAHLEQDLKLVADRQRSRAGTPQPDEVLVPLKQELHHRLQQGEELGTLLSATQGELQAAEERLQVQLFPLCNNLLKGSVTAEFMMIQNRINLFLIITISRFPLRR